MNMTIDFSVIGNRIQKIRKEKGISQTRLASMVGINTSHIGNIETGYKSPSVEILVKIAAAMGVSVDELLSDLEYCCEEDPDVIELLKDCSAEEKVIFKELIRFMKPVLGQFEP